MATSSPRRAIGARGLLAALAVLLILAGCSATGADKQSQTGSQEGYVGAKSLTRVDPGKRKDAPEVSGPVLGGSKGISTTDYDDKIVVLNVWGSWCSPCREEATDLQAASQETEDIAQFVGINTRDSNQAQGVRFNEAHKVTYPSIFDPQGRELLKFAGLLPPAAIPSTLIIDGDGKIAARVLGPISKITLVDLINDVHEGK